MSECLTLEDEISEEERLIKEQLDRLTAQAKLQGNIRTLTIKYVEDKIIKTEKDKLEDHLVLTKLIDDETLKEQIILRHVIDQIDKIIDEMAGLEDEILSNFGEEKYLEIIKLAQLYRVNKSDPKVRLDTIIEAFQFCFDFISVAQTFLQNESEKKYIELEKKYGNNNFYNNISVISNLETYQKDKKLKLTPNQNKDQKQNISNSEEAFLNAVGFLESDDESQEYAAVVKERASINIIVSEEDSSKTKVQQAPQESKTYVEYLPQLLTFKINGKEKIKQKEKNKNMQNENIVVNNQNNQQNQEEIKKQVTEKESTETFLKFLKTEQKDQKDKNEKKLKEDYFEEVIFHLTEYLQNLLKKLKDKAILNFINQQITNLNLLAINNQQNQSKDDDKKKLNFDQLELLLSKLLYLQKKEDSSNIQDPPQNVVVNAQFKQLSQLSSKKFQNFINPY